MTNHDPLLAEQLAYYRARAREYDKWFRREGLHQLGRGAQCAMASGAQQCVFSTRCVCASWRRPRARLRHGGVDDPVAETATRVVGVDAAPEMRELALAKLQDAGKSNVELRVDDLFSWQPDQDYDVVFFAFWLTHVPESDADRFGTASTTRSDPEAASSSWMPRARSPRGTSFTVRDCPIATARPSSGDSRTVGSFRSSSVRSIPTDSHESFVNTALTRALSRQASSSSTDSADVPSEAWSA